MTTFGDMVFQFGGVPVGAPKMFSGKHFFVKPVSGSNGNSGRTPAKAFKTLAYALSQCTANNNDVVYLVAESDSASGTTDYQSTALDWNKDGTHLIGINPGGMISQRSRIAQLSTVKTLENLVTFSADNCYVANISIFQGVASSTASAPIAVIVSGQHNVFDNVMMSGNGDTGGSMDVAGARSLKVTGSENLFRRCYIGLDTVTRATQDTEITFAAGSTAATRNIFEDCIITGYAGAAGYTFAECGSGGMDRFTLFKNCLLLNPVGSAATAMTEAFDTHASQGGLFIMHSCNLVGVTAGQHDAGSTGRVYVNSPAPAANGDGGWSEPVD